MEVLRYKYVFIAMTVLVSIAVTTNENNKKLTNNSTIHDNSCPYSKIIEDLFKIHNKTSDNGIYIKDSERVKSFLSSIVRNVTSKEKVTSKTAEEELIDDIIETINAIKNNFTQSNHSNDSLNEAIILSTNNENTKSNDSKKENKEKYMIDDKPVEKHYIEILTIEPNNTNRENSTSHNIIEVLKDILPIFNDSLTKEMHNITIIDRNKNHTILAEKNISTIIVTYCDKENYTKADINSIDDQTYIKVTNVSDNTDYLENSSDGNDEDIVAANLTLEEKKDLLEAAEYGMQKMHELYSVMEPKLYSLGLWLDDTNPARYVAAFSAPSEESDTFTRYGYASLQAAARLREITRNHTVEDGVESRAEDPEVFSATALRQSSLLQHCPLRGSPKCPPASKRYRTHDGTCNNINHPRWGSTMTPVQRFLAPSYSDGIQAPRRSILGSKLPSAREISSTIHENSNVESSGITHLLMQWGQFLDHDITSTSQSRGFNGSVPRCCKDGGRDFIPKDLMHPECFPIPVPSSDPFYGPRGVRCLDFVRSSPASRDDCALGWREQMNQVSAYIDGSPLYGSSARKSDKLRLFRNGMLQYGRVQQRRPVLPPASAKQQRDSLCRGGALSTTCFTSGDARVNEHPGLVAAHILFLRIHNRIAQELAHLNPHWSDEKIYQETRKIVGAIVQHITYNEFLPIVLGREVIRLFDLDTSKKGYFRSYSPKVNSSPASSFSSAAFRFGHSLVQSSMMRYDRFHRPMTNNVSLHEELTNPSNIWSVGAVDRLLIGMINQPIQKRDEFITEELTNHLFQTPQLDFGMDLAAINIQRGRDHGVPPYTSWREPCGLSAIEEFDDLNKVMQAKTVRKLKAIYRDVADIDLFTGGMAERPVVGGLVGPTFACIIAQQFSNLRKGDRFWYENGGFESSFTPAQLQQLRRISLAQILCQSLDSIETVQPFVFLSSDSPTNDRISCQSKRLNNFDLSPWTELDSESNDIKKSDAETITESSIDNISTTTRKPATTKAGHSQLTTKSNIKKHSATNMTNEQIKKDILSNNPFQNSKNSTNQKLDDKLDFKNKSFRKEDDASTRTKFHKRPIKYKDYDDDQDTQSVQSVVISNLPNSNRPHNRPAISVTENIDKFTYLINYVPRPTQSWRTTTRRNYDRDVVKVTYQTYDDTYRRPINPYFIRQDHIDINSRRDTPDTTDSLHFSARSDDSEETKQTDFYVTTDNINKLVTFGYVGNYKGNIMTDKDKFDYMTYKDKDNSMNNKNNDNIMTDQYKVKTITNKDNGNFMSDQHKVNTMTNKDNDKIMTDQHKVNTLTNKDNDKIMTDQHKVNTMTNKDNGNFMTDQHKVNTMTNKDNDKIMTDQHKVNTMTNKDNGNFMADDYKVNSMTHKDKHNTMTNKDKNNITNDNNTGSTKTDMDKHFTDKVNTMTNKPKLTNDIERRNSMSKDFSTYDTTTQKLYLKDFDNMKLSTFYYYDTVTKPYYNQPKPTSRQDDDQTNTKSKYYYIKNVLHKYDELDLTKNIKNYELDLNKDIDLNKKYDSDKDVDPMHRLVNKDILRENYNNPGRPMETIHERSGLIDALDVIEDTEAKSISKTKKTGPAKTPSVAFDVIPSENIPSQWAVYEEDLSIGENQPHRMPQISSDPSSSIEVPKPIKLSAIKRRPGSL